MDFMKVWSAMAFSCALFTATSSAAIIGTYNGSGRSLNDADMATVRSTLIGAGHTVQADSGITAGGLASMDLFWIGEASSTPTAGELSALTPWVNGGGRLLVLFDSGCSGCIGGNGFLSGIGSTLAASNSSAAVSPFVGGNFATTGGPFNLVGQTLTTSPGMAITGGTLLAGSFLGYQQIGSGFVFAFADRSDHNVFNPTAATVNGQLFLNIAAGAGDSGAVPEPATYALIGASLAGLAILRRRR